MMTSYNMRRFGYLVRNGVISPQELIEAEFAAAARGVELEPVLLEDYGVAREDMLRSLAEFHGCPYIQYDERLPVPTEVFEKLNADVLAMSLWFPVIVEGKKVIIATNNPDSKTVREECGARFSEAEFEFRVALASDITWYIQDFLHAGPQSLIGLERTGLAFWRNTMAQWRTRLACYRTDLAKGRTALSLLRWGLGLVAFSDALIRMRRGASYVGEAYWIMLSAGVVLASFGLLGFLRTRRSRMNTPRHDTLVHVTAATMPFLERYYLEDAPPRRTKGTMLARLGDFIPAHCTVLRPVPASKERTHLARERNILAAQRTIAACYRTMYSSARTGLACIRTGVAFLSFGLVFFHYFSIGLMSLIDLCLAAAGLFMIIDGVRWYLPARKERDKVPRVAV